MAVLVSVHKSLFDFWKKQTALFLFLHLLNSHFSTFPYNEGFHFNVFRVCLGRLWVRQLLAIAPNKYSRFFVATSL